MRTSRKRQLVGTAFALLLAIAALALIAPALSAPVQQKPPKTIQQTPGEQGITAPMQRIEPVSVAVVNFQRLAEAEAKKKVAGIEQKPGEVEVPAPMTIPERFELGANESPEKQTRPEAKAEIGPSVVSPAPGASFAAQFDEPKVGTGGRTIPPDTTGAVGPTKIFSNLNSNYRVQDKTGAFSPSDTVSINSFWAPLNTPTPAPPTALVSGVGDPRVQYDPYNGRWIVAAISNVGSPSSSILVGISASSDPLGSFMLFRFVVGAAPDASQTCNANGEWADFPMLGFNKNWVAVGWNQFSINGGTFVAGKMLILNYPALRAGSANASVTTLATGADFCMHPATTYSSTEDVLYVPAHFNSGSATYRLHKIVGTPSAPVFTVDTVSKTRPGGGWIALASSDIEPQTCTGTPGTTCPTTLRFIDSGDSNIRSSPIFRNGSIWYAQTVGLPAPSPASQTTLTHTAVQWTRLDTTGGFLDGGRINDPNANATSGEWYAYPSITVNANSDVLVGFSNFSGAHFVNAGYAFRAGTDAAGTMRDPVIVKAGEDYYAKTFTGSRNRWGDYSHTVVDPANDLDMWTIQEYAGTRDNTDPTQLSQTITSASRWGTWWAMVANIGSPPPSPTATPSPTPPPVAVPTPPNDAFARAETITGCTGSLNETNVGATKEVGEPNHDPACNAGGASVWYQWQAPASASVTITTVGSNFDTLLGVYTGNTVNALTVVAKNDDVPDVPGQPHQVVSSVTFTAVSGTIYKIAVDGFNGDTGNIVLNWSQSNCTPSSLGVEQNTTQLAAVDSVTFVRGPFTLADTHNFSGDQRTRIIFFTTDLGFAQATSNPDINTLAVVINGTSYPIENVGPSSTPPGSYVVFLLPSNLTPGTYPVSLKARGVMSTNSPTITIVSSPNGPVAKSSPSLFRALYPLVKLLL